MPWLPTRRVLVVLLAPALACGCNLTAGLQPAAQIEVKQHPASTAPQVVTPIQTVGAKPSFSPAVDYGRGTPSPDSGATATPTATTTPAASTSATTNTGIGTATTTTGGSTTAATGAKGRVTAIGVCTSTAPAATPDLLSGSAYGAFNGQHVPNGWATAYATEAEVWAAINTTPDATWACFPKFFPGAYKVYNDLASTYAQ